MSLAASQSARDARTTDASDLAGTNKAMAGRAAMFNNKLPSCVAALLLVECLLLLSPHSSLTTATKSSQDESVNQVVRCRRFH
jgi:hypothetical protein